MKWEGLEEQGSWGDFFILFYLIYLIFYLQIKNFKTSANPSKPKKSKHSKTQNREKFLSVNLNSPIFSQNREKNQKYIKRSLTVKFNLYFSVDQASLRREHLNLKIYREIKKKSLKENKSIVVQYLTNLLSRQTNY